MYKTLNAEKIVETIHALQNRIVERFPDAGLARLVGALEEAAQQAAERSAWIRRPLWLPRLLTAAALAGLVLLVVLEVEEFGLELPLRGWKEFFGTLEAALGSVVFIGAGVLFMATLETRIKRRRALAVVYELRSMAHIIDMHQLTKDPHRVEADPESNTASSPRRTLTSFELMRYYDYCCEALALTSKVGAIYVQGFSDAVVLQAVDEIESLSTGIARKVWQKALLLDRSLAADGAVADESTAPAL